MGYMERYDYWLSSETFDDKTKEELRGIAGDEREIEDRFYRELEFGTAGLRGVIGAGENRMNVYTVRKATQGLANYILSQKAADKGVAISYDSRHFSPEFADEAALVLAANGIKAYVFDSLRPTPELSFAVRFLGCTAGINITASHNPPEYNGYKVYWADGAQITPPHDKGIMDEVKAITDFSVPKTMELEAAKKEGLYETIGEKLDAAYEDELLKLVINRDVIGEMADSLNIVYTPLHGTGNIPVRRVLKRLGFKNVHVVKEQELPDGDFPTVSYPNPETEEAFELGVKLAGETDAELILATDPDADRLGVYVKDKESGEFHALTGNMSGCLIGEYIISQRKAKGGLPKDGAFIKSIVSTNLADAIASYYDVSLVEVLTGFKYIGQKMLEFDEKKNGTYLFGMEESYGCLPGTYARDKDAVAASMMLCEAAAYYKKQGKTLWDAMLDIYGKYGYYNDSVKSITLAGKEGIEKIGSIMEELRSDPPKEIAGLEVVSFRDYKKGVITEKDGNTRPSGLPEANVLYFDLPDSAWVCVRPSGTEPKLKLYYGVKGSGFDDAAEKGEKLKAGLDALIDAIM